MWASPITKLTLAPVLIAQGLFVGARAVRLPEPPGPRAGVAGQGAPLRLLICGDSSAAGVGADHQDDALSGQLLRALSPDFCVTWRLEAQTGATTSATTARLAALLPDPFDVAVVALGVNDVTRGATPTRWLPRVQGLCDLLHGRFGVQHVIWTGVPPMEQFPLLPWPLRRVLGAAATKLDAGLAAHAAKSNGRLVHLPLALDLDESAMARDGFHPGPPVYAAWADLLADTIRARITAPPSAPVPRPV